MFKTNTKLHDIHAQTIVQSFISAIVGCKDWETEMLNIPDVNSCIQLWEHLRDKWGNESVHSMSYQDVRNLIDEARAQLYEKYDDEQWERIVNKTVNLVRLDVDDMENFEIWFRKAIKTINVGDV